MSILPRLAVGTIQPEADSQAMMWALLDTLDDIGQCHPEFILTCVEPDISEPNDLDLDEVDRQFDAAVAARLKPEKAHTFN